MSLDRFGRTAHLNSVRKVLNKSDLVTMSYFHDKAIIKTHHNHLNFENLILKNIGNPSDDSCSVNLGYFKRKSLFLSKDSFDCKNHILKNVGTPVEATDCLNVKSFIDSMGEFVYKYSVCIRDGEEGEVYSALNKRIHEVAEPIHDTDVVTLSYLKKELKKITNNKHVTQRKV